MSKKILIADDEQDVVMILQSALKREGFEVITAADGQEAKEKIIGEAPDVVLLDLMMPRLNGWQVLEWLRREHRSNVPTIIISGKDEMGSIKKSYDLEADYYIIKPVKLADVLKGIETILFLKTQEKDDSENDISAS